LKAANGWKHTLNFDVLGGLQSGNGADLYDFNAIPGGYCDSLGNFNSICEQGLWWSADEHSKSNAKQTTNYANYWYMSYGDEGILKGSLFEKNYLLSVRYVKD
jgi:uncharacterized protein (TIGR02145 family)